MLGGRTLSAPLQQAVDRQVSNNDLRAPLETRPPAVGRSDVEPGECRAPASTPRITEAMEKKVGPGGESGSENVL